VRVVPERADDDTDRLGRAPESSENPESSELDPFLSAKHGGTKLYLIRHADALPDAEELQSVDYDAQNLSALGRRQAQALADRLSEIRFDAIYTSPLARTRQTAAPLARALGLEPQVVDDLREIELGPVGPALPEGATPSEVAAHLRDRLRTIALRAAAEGSWRSIPGSEPSDAFRARVVGAHDALAARHPGGRIACFGHGGSINVFLAAVLGLDRDFFVPIANTAISIVRVKGERRVLLAVNDVCHLRESGLLQLP
jgi:probable phosphoglycerate mutase